MNPTALVRRVATLSTAAPTIHVFPIIGQSNAIGCNSGGHTTQDVPHKRILQTSNSNKECQLIEAQDPLHHSSDPEYINSRSVGFAMSFAGELTAELPKEDLVILVPAAIAGTGFVDKVWTAYTGCGFIAALDRIRATFNIIPNKYPQHTAKLAGYLWHQGEFEAEAHTTTEDYLTKKIVPMINAWRDSKLLPQTNSKVPFVAGNMVPSWVADPAEPQRQNVSVAIQLLSQRVPHTASVPSQGLVGDEQEGATAVHFSVPSQRILGNRYFAAWKSAQLNGSVDDC